MIDEFIGIYLTKVELEAFKLIKISLIKFNSQLKRKSLYLNQKTKALYLGNNFYINGIKINVEPCSSKKFKNFFDEGVIDASTFNDKTILLLLSLFKKEFIVFKRKFII